MHDPAREAEDAKKWFSARHVRLHTYREGDAYWTDLLATRNRRFRAVRYGSGDTPEAAVLRAKSRWVQEQGSE
jgi:hypothetical protein